MIKGLLNHNTNGSTYEYLELMSYARKYNIDLIDAWKADESEDYAFTLNRSFFPKDLALQQGIQINRLIDDFFWRNKSNQLKYLDTSVKMPKSLFGAQTFAACSEYLGLPFVAKQSVSSRGLGVFLIKSPKDFENAVGCDIFQEVIWDSFGKDLRVIALGGKIYGVMNRVNEGKFKANIHQGGIGIPYKCDSDIEKCISSIYKIYKVVT